jgi:hypothetical protein
MNKIERRVPVIPLTISKTFKVFAIFISFTLKQKKHILCTIVLFYVSHVHYRHVGLIILF